MDDEDVQVEQAETQLSDLETRTRLGYILEGCVKYALNEAGISFRQSWQFDPALMTPDFTIPDSDIPEFVVEITQVESRNVFQRKLLRYIQAVADAKSYFGPQIVSLNVLFGDTSTLPSSSVSLLESLFDVSVFPTDPARGYIHADLVQLQSEALRLANLSSASASSNSVAILAETHLPAIRTLGMHLKQILESARTKQELIPLWAAEQDRRNRAERVAIVPKPAKFYKEALLQSLYLPASVLAELRKPRGKAEVSELQGEYLEKLGVLEKRDSLLGQFYVAAPPLGTYISNSTFAHYCEMCDSALGSELSMRWHFADIQYPSRLLTMAEHFIRFAKAGKTTLVTALEDNVYNADYLGISHTRCWLADFLPAASGRNHNYYNNAMLSRPSFKPTIANPFNNLTMRSERLLASQKLIPSYCAAAVDVFYQAVAERGIDIMELSAPELAQRVLAVRVYASKGLQRLNPLHVVITGIAQSLGLTCEKTRVASFLFDLSSGQAPVGKYDMLRISGPGNRRYVLVNGLYIGQGYESDHKADEWSARRRVIQYRVRSGSIVQNDFTDSVFVYDGNWSAKSLTKLHRSGWSHLCQLDETEQVLRGIFEIPAL